MKYLRRAALVAATSIALALPAAAVTPANWTVARSMSLPAQGTDIPDGFISSLSCLSASSCVAAGAYTNAQGEILGLIETERNGTWLSPTSLKPPAGAAGDPGVTLYQVSCGAAGSCVAVGSYDTDTSALPLLVEERAGRWQQGRALVLPANALIKGQDATLRAVSCKRSTTCSAIGTYQDNNPVGPRSEGFVANEVSGVWRRATEIALPKSNFDPFVSLNQLSCPSAGNCVAIGSFIDANDVTQALVVSETNGVWHSGEAIAPPPDASRFAGASWSEVTCSSDASCAVLGTFNSSTGAVEAMVDSESDGAWGAAIPVTLPPDAAANPRVLLFGFDGIACSSLGYCSLGGQYKDSAGKYEGFLANEDAGNWSAAQGVDLPVGGASGGANGGIVALSCPRSDNCEASGSYLDSSGNYQALVVNEVNGVWQRASEVTLPAGATTVGVDGGVYAIDCWSDASCVGIGSYLKGSSTYEGFTLTG
ncbi:MAG: hypothetical protein WA580_01905 [Acidimicrobiales bacterium]